MKELSKNLSLHNELSRIEEIRKNFKSKAYSASTPIHSGIPHGGCVKQKTELFTIQISDLETRIAYLKTAIMHEQNLVTAYCDEIDDLKVRTVFQLRFLYCMSWKEVADMMGKYYTGESVRKICYKYLRN